MNDTANLEITWRTSMMLMVCLPIFICMLKLFFSQHEQKASKVLAAGLLVCLLSIGPQIIGFAGFYQVYPGLTFFPFATELWFGPLIYLHAHLLIKSGPLGWRKYLVIPGVIQSAYYSWAFLFLGDYQAKWAFSRSFHSIYITPIESILAILMLIAALVCTWRMSSQYREFLANTASNASEFDPVWLRRIIIIVLFFGFVFACIEIATLVIDLSYVDAFGFQVLVMMGVAWFAIEAVWRLNQAFPKYSNSFTHSVYNATNVGPSAGESIQPAATIEESSDKAKLQEIAKQIDSSLREKAWYLEPKLSLSQLAAKIGSNELYVSKAINQILKLSFNDYINQMRVKRAQTLMLESDKAMLSIALDSGFNSKATFNRVFKQMTRLTPSQYRKQKGLKS